MVLDAYDLSTIQGSSPEATLAAEALLATRRPGPGEEGPALRFQPWNGGLGQEQLAWLAATLEEAEGAGEQVVLLTHLPVCPAATTHISLLWNYEEVLEELDRRRGTVLAVLAGHDHSGGVAERAGVWHLTLGSPLLVVGEEECWGEVEVWGEGLVWRGRGRGGPHHISIPFLS